MRYVAAFLLASLGGNESPSADDIKKILNSVGIESDDERIKALLAGVAGKSADAVR
jgi:large subunit ribosomal protein LP2